MNRKSVSLVWLVSIGLILVACSANQPSTRPTRTPKPDRTERPSHYALDLNYRKLGDYLYRGFVQVPRGMTLGPDGKIYIADWNGRHILVIDNDEQISDLGLWKNPIRWNKTGPQFVDFDSEGNLYVVSYGHILKVFPDGTTDDVTGHNAFLFGGIAINNQDQVFYAERSKGEVFTISPEGERITIASDLEDAEGMVFGLDGTLYVAQSRLNKVVQIDVESGKVRPFFSWDSYIFTTYLTVDADGDIWIRGHNQAGTTGQGTLFQVGPDGIEKPFWVGGEKYDSKRELFLRTSGGIAFDEEGQLWIASYSSEIFRLSHPVPGEKDSWDSLDIIFPGMAALAMTVDENNSVIFPNEHTNEIWKIDSDGNVETILERTGADSLVVGPDGILYLGLPGEIIRINEQGGLEHFADIHAISMAFGSDGILYAVSSSKPDGTFEVVRIPGPDEIEKVTNEIGGYLLGAGPYQHPDNHYIKLEPAIEQGFFVFDPSHYALLYLDFTGTGHLVRELEAGNSSIRVTVAPDGTIYYLNNELYDVQVIYPDGSSETVAFDLYGDPGALMLSYDGQWLFVMENGAIEKIKT